MIFLVLFVLIPLVELYFMLQVSDVVGAFNTVMLVVLTAVAGGLLVRFQGFTTLMRMRESMQHGELPALEIIEGSILLVCGVMLLLPGFVTDAIGFLLLIPPLRRALVVAVLKRRDIMQKPSSSNIYDAEVVYEKDQNGEVVRRRVTHIIEGESWTDKDK